MIENKQEPETSFQICKLFINFFRIAVKKLLKKWTISFVFVPKMLIFSLIVGTGCELISISTRMPGCLVVCIWQTGQRELIKWLQICQFIWSHYRTERFHYTFMSLYVYVRVWYKRKRWSVAVQLIEKSCTLSTSSIYCQMSFWRFIYQIFMLYRL